MQSILQAFSEVLLTSLSFILICILFFLLPYFIAIFIAEKTQLRLIYTFALAPLLLSVQFFALDIFFSITKTSILVFDTVVFVVLLSFLFLSNAILIKKKRIIPEDLNIFLELLSLKNTHHHLLKMLFYISLLLIFWIVVVLPYFTQDNIHFLVSADIADYIQQNQHYPFIKSIHNIAWVIYYPPIVPYTVAFIDLFHFGDLLVLYSLFPLLYLLAFLVLLYYFIQQNKFPSLVFYGFFFLFVASTVMARTFISQITNDLYTLFYALLLLYYFTDKNLFSQESNKVYLSLLFVGFSFLVRPYFGIIAVIILFVLVVFRFSDVRQLVQRKLFQLTAILLLSLFLAFFWYGHVYYTTGNPFYPIPSKIFMPAAYEGNSFLTEETAKLAEKSLQLTWQGSLPQKINAVFFSNISFESFSSFLLTFFASIIHIAANPFSLLIILLSLLFFFVRADYKREYRIFFTITALFSAFVFVLWLFVDNALKSPKFFFILIPAVYLFALLSCSLFFKQQNYERFLALLVILLFFVFLVNLFYLGFGTLNQNFELLKNPVPSNAEAAAIELKQIPNLASKINITENDQILFLSRAETVGAVSFFLQQQLHQEYNQQKYIWQYLWYDSEKAVRLHSMDNKKDLLFFLQQNNIKYIITAKERLAGEIIAYRDATHPQLLPELILQNDPHFIKIAETSDLTWSKPAKNIVVYEVKYLGYS